MEGKMKFKKSILLTTLTFLMIIVLSMFTNAKAATGSKELNLKMLRNSGYGYQLGNTKKNVWKIYEPGGTGETIYCLKGGPGFGSSDFLSGSPTLTEYTRYYDMKDPDNIPSTYQTALPDVDSNTYKALLWVLDNCYVAPKTNASTEERNQAAEYRSILLDAATKYALEQGNPDIESDYEFSFLTDDDIDSVQQLVVWYFTNPTGDYHVETFNFWLNTVAGNENSVYADLSSETYFENGWERAVACQALFDYLVQNAEAEAPNYNISSSTITIAPVQIANTTVTIETVGNRIVIGPYRLQENSNVNYSLTATLTDGNNNTISDVILLDNSKTATASGTTIKDLVGQNFYISVPASTNTSKITLKIDGSYFKTSATYWSVANPTTNDQPVAVVEKTKQTFTDTKVITSEPEKYFDLALRKFITSINNVPIPTEESREPSITAEELAKLKNGQTETANKVHPKNALLVKTGDTVVYTIRVYNEGEIDGYATEITDHLPAGLKLKEESTINTANGWSNPSGDGKTIATTALQDALIPAFNGTTLEYRDLQIECEVIATITDKDQTLRNIAEISKHKDKDGNTGDIDRDSQPGNVNTGTFNENNHQDDEDFEKLVLLGQYFDLSLRKFITTVSHDGTVTTYDRAPSVDTTTLKNGKVDTNGGINATYNHTKEAVSVDIGDIVTYTIRVYNEGQLNGYVTKITDHLPAQLEFIVNDELNAKYGWKIVSTDGRTVSTDITSPTTANSANRDSIYQDRTASSDKVLLEKFDGGNSLDYIDVQIRCKVKENIDLYEKITNIAEITDFTDENGNTITDRDSRGGNVVLPSDKTLPEYKDTEIEKGDEYIPGQQDDDDFEKLILRRFDLALRKFITEVNEKEIINRAPVFKKVSDKEYKYEHTKEPVEVANGNTVIYTLRIFNEGNVGGYATEVKDNIPDGLEFLPDHDTNKEYRWVMYREDGTKTEEVSEAAYIKTDYLAMEQEKVDEEGYTKYIRPFDPETMTMPDYKDIKIAFKVTEPNTSDRIIINTAEITDDSDKEGNPIDDIDSIPDNNKDGEDDIDIEKIKVKFFDLSLKKWVTESIVTYDGKTTVTKTGHTGDENPETPAKVEIRGSRISKTTVKFKFAIKVTNEGEIAGYVKEISDYIPEGLKFVEKDNPDWKEVDGKVVTDKLKDTLLEPGESATVEIILTWINNKDNMGEKVNWAEISKDENEYNSPDIDSIPNNQQKGEDDIDSAPVILSVVTGNAQTYITLIFASLSIFTAGVILIKKFVI